MSNENLLFDNEKVFLPECADWARVGICSSDRAVLPLGTYPIVTISPGWCCCICSSFAEEPSVAVAVLCSFTALYWHLVMFLKKL